MTHPNDNATCDCPPAIGEPRHSIVSTSAAGCAAHCADGARKRWKVS
jgi:hypothetical protein